MSETDNEHKHGAKTELKKKKRAYTFFYHLLSGAARRLCRVRVVNPENEPIEGNFIVACNHTAAADPIVICATMKGQVRFMAKKELFKVPLLGWFLKAIGCYPVNRGGSDVSALRMTIGLLEEGSSVGIFPQGTRMPGIDPKDAKVKSGIGLIAAKSGVDILPVCIKSKSGKTQFLKKNYLVIGKLIKSEELDIENNGGTDGHQRIAEHIFTEVTRLWHETDIDEIENARKHKSRR